MAKKVKKSKRAKAVSKIKNKKKIKKEDKSSQKQKEIRKFYAKKRENEMTQVQTLKYLKSMVEKYDREKDIRFRDYIEERARKKRKNKSYNGNFQNFC